MQFKIESIRDIAKLVKELAFGFSRLSFEENFESFEEDIVISATSYTIVRNKLRFIPSRYIIVSQEGNGLITKTTGSEWTSDYLYLTNNGAAEVTATIVFLK